MFSPRKKEDKELLLEIMETIEVLVKVGTSKSLDVAEKLGENYVALKEKIKTHDYTEDDKRIEVLNRTYENIK